MLSVEEGGGVGLLGTSLLFMILDWNLYIFIDFLSFDLLFRDTFNGGRSSMTLTKNEEEKVKKGQS